MSESNNSPIKRELIGSLELGKTLKGGKPVVDLFSTDTRLQFPVLRLFDLSALQVVGIEPDILEEGQRRHTRFWAYYTESDKTNKDGNAYKDVAYLEPIDPASSAPVVPTVDLGALLDELRAIRGLLHLVVEGMELMGMSGNGPTSAPAPVPQAPAPAPAPEPVKPEAPAPAGTETPDDLDVALGRALPASEPHRGPAPGPRANHVTAEIPAGDPPARKPTDLLRAVNAHVTVPFDSLQALAHAVEARIGQVWKPWPAYNNTLGWWEYYKAAVAYAEALVKPATGNGTDGDEALPFS